MRSLVVGDFWADREQKEIVDFAQMVLCFCALDPHSRGLNLLGLHDRAPARRFMAQQRNDMVDHGRNI